MQCGAKHLKFWSVGKGGSLAAQTPGTSKSGPKATLSQHFLCVDFYPDGSALIGAASGDILQFRGNERRAHMPINPLLVHCSDIDYQSLVLGFASTLLTGLLEYSNLEPLKPLCSIFRRSNPRLRPHQCPLWLCLGAAGDA